ncbi:MAG: site-specific integrase [Clostridiales bacterium]|nr:site-specific integrase [Clostridiales bacterium]
MAAYKDKNGTWFISCRYNNWKGERKQKLKRGFSTKREALEWERNFLQKQKADLDMPFESFVELYQEDLKNKIRHHTWKIKNNMIAYKLVPYFKNKKLCEITPRDIIAWQNELIAQGYSATYLKSIHNQLSAIFNHAVQFYDLKSNPAAKVGPMGKKESTKEMLFWTKEEYLKFADSVMDKPMSFYAFEMLYWCGLRVGELLALTPADFDFSKGTVSITKSYQRLSGKDIITDPKTPKSKRVISMPDFLCEEIQEYIASLYGIQPSDRIFPITKSYLHHEMTRGATAAGVKRIRIHDLRHSHVSLLIDMGFTALAIADRLGHESIDITYRYAHLFPSKQVEIAQKLSIERNEPNVAEKT